VRRVVGEVDANNPCDMCSLPLLAIVLLVSTSPAWCEAQSSTQAGCTTADGDRVALVLPGGGVRGMAHIGVGGTDGFPGLNIGEVTGQWYARVGRWL